MPLTTKNSICLFACHFKNNSIPQYLRIYLKEISRYTARTILINSDPTYLKSDSSFLEENNITPLTIPNLGHDFGSWMSALDNINQQDYEYFLFVNDSCMLTDPLKPFFKWFKHHEFDFSGMINSNERKYHLQSYFMVCNHTGLKVINESFKKHGIIEDKRKLIKNYEVGISQSQLKLKNKVGSFLEIPKANKNNPLFHQTLGLIESQFPLVKKQLVFNQLSTHNITTLKGAGIYTGPEVIKTAIKEHSSFQNINWDTIFKDIPNNN